jgi:hypothetical protein
MDTHGSFSGLNISASIGVDLNIVIDVSFVGYISTWGATTVIANVRHVLNHSACTSIASQHFIHAHDTTGSAGEKTHFSISGLNISTGIGIDFNIVVDVGLIYDVWS